MTLKERYQYVIEYFSQAMPTAESELNFNTPFELLVAVVLSAQCTDKRVNMTTPALFAAYPTAEAMSKATVEEIYEYIKSISYPNNKAKHLATLARQIVERFDGQVPYDPKDLESLQGVGRKSAMRMAFSVLDLNEEEAEIFAQAIIDAKRKIHMCPICQNLTDREVCNVCEDLQRDRSVICVVEDPRDVLAIERTREHNGLDHFQNNGMFYRISCR